MICYLVLIISLWIDYIHIYERKIDHVIRYIIRFWEIIDFLLEKKRIVFFIVVAFGVTTTEIGFNSDCIGKARHIVGINATEVVWPE